METLRDTLLDTFFPDKDSAVSSSASPEPEKRPFPTEVPPPTHCCMCGTKIEVMSFKGTRVCSTNCDKAARGETPDGWIETRVGRIGFRIGKMVRFDLVDPFLHVEGELAEVGDSERSPVARKIVLKDAKGKTKTMRRGVVMDTAARGVGTSYDLPIDHRIDFKP